MNLLTGAKHSAFSTNYLVDTNKTFKHNQNQEQQNNLNNNTKTTQMHILKQMKLKPIMPSGQEMHWTYSTVVAVQTDIFIFLTSNSQSRNSKSVNRLLVIQFSIKNDRNITDVTTELEKKQLLPEGRWWRTIFKLFNLFNIVVAWICAQTFINK